MYEVVISVCGLAVWGWFLRRGRSALPREPHRAAPWRGAEMLILTLAFVAALMGSHHLMLVLAGQVGEKTPRLSLGFGVGVMALTNGLTVLAAVLLARRYGRPGVGALGLGRASWLEQIVFGFVGFFAIMPVLLGYTLILGPVADLLHYTIETQEVVRVFKTGPRTASFNLMVLYALVGAPILEEIIFRGFFQGYVRRLFRPGGAIFMSALLFAFFHYPPVHVAVAIFLLGVVLGYQRERTRSLVAPMITHVLFNLHTYIVTQVGRM